MNKKNNEGGLLPVIVICAPTACGKTDLAYKLFSSSVPSLFSGRAEIISADSMQVYKHMDIGTAKPNTEFQKKLPHHLIDVCTPDKQFGVGDFVRLTEKAIKDINARGKIPVMIGGTAFYIKNYVHGLPTTPSVTEDVRLEIENRMSNEGAEKLWNELKKVDPISAEKIHINDEYRIKRSLEVYHATGLPRSSFGLSKEHSKNCNFLIFSLYRQRLELYERVEKRVDEMFDAGLEREVEMLKDLGYTVDSPGMQGIGYREFFMSNDIKEVKAKIIKSTKEYVKRQQTFFKSFDEAEVIHPENLLEIEKKIHNFCLHNNEGT